MLELRQSRHPGRLLSKMNLRKVPDPLVYTRGQPLNCMPSLATVTCAVSGVALGGLTHRIMLSLTYSASTSSNCASVAKRTLATRERLKPEP